MKLQPLRPARSHWQHERDLPVTPEVMGHVCRRRVEDGMLTAIVALEPHGWHMSISFAALAGPHRYPTWDEIAHGRYALLPGHLDFVMHLPPLDEYVSVHPTTFHLHEHPAREVL